LMFIVDDAGSFLPAMNHSPWEGVTIADFVMPFFLFIVGVALALAVLDKLDATQRQHFLKLLHVGFVLQGVRSLTFGVDIAQIRLMGILQRIAIAYLVTTLCQIWLKGEDDADSGLDLIKRYRYQLLAGLLITIAYMALLYGTYVPNWEYRISGLGSTKKTFTVSWNAVGMIDRKILGIQDLYGRPVYARSQQCSIDSPQNGPLPRDAPSWCEAPFDPEGLLRSEKHDTFKVTTTCKIGLKHTYIVSLHILLHWQRHTFAYILIVFTCLYVEFRLIFSWTGSHGLDFTVAIKCKAVHPTYEASPSRSKLRFCGARAKPC
ncbi:hypothetical protein ZWY2020_032216, partial [Hordeum vulgare]